MSQLFRRTVDGFACYGLRNETISVEVVPELGAKILSLVNRQTGREWMWTPPDRGALFRNRLGDLFDDSTLIGADECIPTMGPCTWKGRDLPDHGEAWSMAWTLDEAALAQDRIVTALRLPISPFFFERSLWLQGNRVVLDYRLRNLADEANEYLWALHPMMPIAEGDRIDLPPESWIVMMVEASTNPIWEGRGWAIGWPQPTEAPEIQFDHMILEQANPERAAIKMFTLRKKAAWAAIRNTKTGDSISYHFDPQILDTLGIWINRGGWNGYQHVALEPSTGAPDPLDVAVTGWERFRTIAPGAEQTWRVEIELGRHEIIQK